MELWLKAELVERRSCEVVVVKKKTWTGAGCPVSAGKDLILDWRNFALFVIESRYAPERLILAARRGGQPQRAERKVAAPLRRSAEDHSRGAPDDLHSSWRTKRMRMQQRAQVFYVNSALPKGMPSLHYLYFKVCQDRSKRNAEQKPRVFTDF